MNAVENMYETGDDETKKAIAQAWVKSQDKMNAITQQAREQKEKNDKMFSKVVETSDFTIYKP